MADSVETIVNNRLDADGDLDDDAKLYVMAALDGTLDEVIQGGDDREPPPRPDTPETPAGAYLRRVSVTGFRGIGPRADLDVVPGPGLTLVVGANGTGKSSFAEGLEFLLTGRNSRWQDKSAEWRQGWRNLHAQEPPELQASFTVDGQPEDAVVSRRWNAATTGIEDHTLQGLEDLEWTAALDTHRPFLSYDQLSDIVDKGPSAQYDAMASGLGLERLSEARERLRDQRLRDQRAYRDARQQRDALLSGLKALDDERAYRVRAALAEEPWRLERIHHVLEGVLDDDLAEDVSSPSGLRRMPPSYRDRALWLLKRPPPVVYGYVSDLPDARNPEPETKISVVYSSTSDLPDEWLDVSDEEPPPYRHRPLDLLQRLATIEFPTAAEVEETCRKLRDIVPRLQALRGSNEKSAALRYAAVQAALRVHAHEGDRVCPACETGRLDERWKNTAEARLKALELEAKEASMASSDLFELVHEIEDLTFGPPECLAEAGRVDVDASDVFQAWAEWQFAIADEPSLPDPDEFLHDIEPRSVFDHPVTRDIRNLHEFPNRYESTYSLSEQGLLQVAGRLTERGANVREALGKLCQRAQAELDRRENLWRPLRRQLLEWLPTARRGQEASARLTAVQAAANWLTNVEDDVRAERFRPIAERARRYWGVMGKGSSVALNNLTLTGQATRRHLELTTRIDGQAGAALGVMSQGELNALSLSLFLARALLPESPFRFLVIDDPVQAMDPTKVEGLARVLAEAAEERQVIVFTHDERLPAAARRLRIEHRLLAVTRRENSQVLCQLVEEPVKRHLDDARAVLLTDPVGNETRRRVIPGFCRQALEAACVEAVWSNRTDAGRDYAETEQDVANAQTLNDKLTLVLLDDSDGNHQAMRSALYQRFGTRARDVVDACNRGAHGHWTGGIDALIDGAEWLAKRLLAQSTR